MSTRRTSFEGQSPGLQMTALNSGSGAGDTPLNQLTVAVGAGNPTPTREFDTTHTSPRGAQSAHFVGNLNDTITAIYSGASAASAAVSALIWFGALPSSTGVLFQLRTEGSPTRAAQFGISSANKLTILDGAGVTKKTFANTITPGQGYRCYLGSTPGTGTTDGSIFGAYYLDDATTLPSGETAYSATNVNASVGPILNGRVGKLTNTQGPIEMWVDEFTFVDGSAADPGVPVVTGTAYTQSVQPYDLVTLPAGTWTQVSGPAVTLASNTFVAPALPNGAVIGFTRSADTETVTVAPHTFFRIEAGGPIPVRFSVL